MRVRYVLKDIDDNTYNIDDSSLRISDEVSTVGLISLSFKSKIKLNKKRLDYLKIINLNTNGIVRDGVILNIKQVRNLSHYEIEIEMETGERIIKNEYITNDFNIGSSEESYDLTLNVLLDFINSNLNYVTSVVLLDASLGNTVIDNKVYEADSLLDILNNIVDLLGGFWFYKNRSVYINNLSLSNSDIIFYDSDLITDSLTINSNSDRYVTSVFYTDAHIDKSFTYQKNGDSSSRIFKLDYPVFGIPEIYVMDDYESVGEAGQWVKKTVDYYDFQDEGLADFYFGSRDNTITQNSTLDVLTTSGKIKVKYTGLIPFREIVDVSEEVNDVLQRSNGLAARETLINDNFVVGLNNINRMAKTLISNYKKESVELSFQTRNIKGVSIGDTVLCDLNRFEITDNFIVKKIEIETYKGNVLYNLTLAKGTLRLSTDDGIKNEVKKLVKGNSKVKRDSGSSQVSGGVTTTSDGYLVFKTVEDELDDATVKRLPVGSSWVLDNSK